MLKQTVVVFKPDLAYCYGAKRVTVNCHQQVIKGYGHVLGIDLCDSSSWCLSAERQDEGSSKCMESSLQSSTTSRIH